MQLPGYELDGPIGFGAAGATWLARDADGAAVAVRVLGPVPQHRHHARLERLESLARIRQPHLVALREVIDVDTGELAVVTDAVPGPTLATLRVGRRALGMGEVIGVGAQLASALVVLHEAQITHGDIAPANVVLTPGHGAVLVDLAGEPAWEAGTGGFAAPEVEQGAVATAASDVYALARLVHWLAADEDRAALADLLGAALRRDPGGRCSAAALQQVLRAQPHDAVDVPDLRSLAGVSLREHAQRDLTRRKSDHRPRHRAAPNRTPLVVAGIVLITMITAAGLWLWPGGTSDDGAADGADRSGGPEVTGVDRSGSPEVTSVDRSGGPELTGAGEDAVAAVHRLTRERDDALNQADAHALTSLSVPGSPAAAQDQVLVEALTSGALAVQGLATDVIAAEDVPAPAADPSGDVDPGLTGTSWVRAVLQAGEHTRSTAAGVVTVAAAQTCVVLDLQRGEGRWQVYQVHSC